MSGYLELLCTAVDAESDSLNDLVILANGQSAGIAWPIFNKRERGFKTGCGIPLGTYWSTS